MESVNDIPIPLDWDMESTTGAITQPYGATPVGVYTIKIVATDANGDTGGGGVYGARAYDQILVITIGEEDLNDELSNDTCFTFPTPNSPVPGTPYLLVQPEATPVGSGGSGFSGAASGIWYISDRVLNPDVPADFASAFSDNTILPVGAYITIPGIETNNVFKVGEGAHTAGTLAMNLSIIGKQEDWGAQEINMYIRFIGNNNSNYENRWIPISAINYPEVSNASFQPVMRSEDSFFPPSNTYADWPQQLNAKPSDLYDPTAGGVENKKNTVPSSTPGQNSLGEGWANYIRCYNFADYSSIEGIEYAWTITNLRGKADVDHPEDRSVAWLTIDDLNNPTCVPWQGINVVGNLVDPAVKAFPYRYSDYSNSMDYADCPRNRVLYASTPYVDYVRVLFTDTTFSTASIPSEGTPCMNYNLALDSDSFINDLPPWNYGNVNGGNGDDMNLRVVSTFSHENGNRLDNPTPFQSPGALIGNGYAGGGNQNFTFDEANGMSINIAGSQNRAISRIKTTLSPL